MALFPIPIEIMSPRALTILHIFLDLKSSECYDPSLDAWAPVVEMSVCCSGVGIGVLDGIHHMLLMVVIDKSIIVCIKACRASAGVLIDIADMHLSRYNPNDYNRNIMGENILKNVLNINLFFCHILAYELWFIKE